MWVRCVPCHAWRSCAAATGPRASAAAASAGRRAGTGQLQAPTRRSGASVRCALQVDLCCPRCARGCVAVGAQAKVGSCPPLLLTNSGAAVEPDGDTRWDPPPDVVAAVVGAAAAPTRAADALPVSYSFCIVGLRRLLVGDGQRGRPPVPGRHAGRASGAAARRSGRLAPACACRAPFPASSRTPCVGPSTHMYSPLSQGSRAQEGPDR